MNQTFSKWLRTSNEAKAFRDAFELVDQMPLDFRLKAKTFAVVEAEAGAKWEETKYSLERGS